MALGLETVPCFEQAAASTIAVTTSAILGVVIVINLSEHIYAFNAATMMKRPITGLCDPKQRALREIGRNRDDGSAADWLLPRLTSEH